MLRLESYLSPFLLSYLSKYIKDIEAKDLKLSLWGGDAILHNLQFKLDALDNELGKIPFSFVSCHAQELVIHVPWSKLASESVVITLNTVECVLTLDCHKTLIKPALRPDQKDEPSTQPSYVNSLLKKIKNNITINVNNLIIKYVEDDIVLSTNIQSVTYQCVDELWNPAFVELTDGSPVLRRLWELKDVTVCLDKRGASGLVETFEEPLLFRTHFVFREHNVYSSPASSKPLATKINLMINRYELNISENQLPAFIHLLQLCFYLYYQSIETSIQEVDSDDGQQDTSQKQGWASWAWSYVPPVLSYEVEENEVRSSIFSFAIYIKNIVIKFKVSKSKLDTSKQFRTSESSYTRPLMEITCEGFALELVAKGLEVFSCITSLCNGSIRFLGGLPSKLNGQTIPKCDSEICVLLASGGGPLAGFAADSLFDFRSPENNNTLYDYALTKEYFFSVNGQKKPHVFFSQYFYLASDARNQSVSEEVEFSDYLKDATLTNVNEWSNIHEQSWKTFYIGGEKSSVRVNSYTLLCAKILTSWAKNHTIKPYPLASPSTISAPEQLQDLNFIPSRSSSFVFKNTQISFATLFMQPVTFHDKLFAKVEPAAVDSLLKELQTQSDKAGVALPAIVIDIPISEFTIHQPMYGTHFAVYLSSFMSPLPHFIKACSTQYSAKIPAVYAYLWHDSVAPPLELYLPTNLPPILHVDHFEIDHELLHGKEYWKKRTTMLCSQTNLMLSKLSVNVAFPRFEIVSHLIDSWFSVLQKENSCATVLDVSQIKEILCDHLSATVIVVLDSFMMNINETFVKTSVCSTIKKLDLFLKSLENVVPIMQLSHFFEPMHDPEQFLMPVSPKDCEKSTEMNTDWHENTQSISFYFQMPHFTSDGGCILLNVNTFFVNVDPSVLDFISNFPSIPLEYLLPTILSLKSSDSESSSQTAFIKSVKANYALQFRCKGGQLLVLQQSHPCSIKDYCAYPAFQITQRNILLSKSSVLSLSFPKLTSYTSGFKPIQISSRLPNKGVTVNKFTEFGTLNFGLENAAVYTVHSNNSNTLRADYIVKPCASACTIVFKHPEESKVNIALHVDLEPIVVQFGKHQIVLLVEAFNSILLVFHHLEKFYTPASSDSESMSKFNWIKSKTDDTTDSKITTNNAIGEKNEEDLKSRTLLVPATQSRNLPFTLWMQCTLPRFTLEIFCSDTAKNIFYIDDMSMSLDVQSVYLKLMMSLSTCIMDYWVKYNNEWTKNSLNSLRFGPMFSVLPSFVQKFNAPKEKCATESKAEHSVKFGKFLELTFTEVLASDYHRNLQDSGSGDHSEQASTSVLTTGSEAMMTSIANVTELICSIQGFDVLLNPEPVYDLINVFLPLLELKFWKISKKIASSNQTNSLPMLYLTISGARLFLPSDKLDSKTDDVLMLCIGSLDINPHPQNPLTRLIVSQSIYKRAKSAGLLSFPGSSLEDKQFEISFVDFSLGTTKSKSIIDHLNKPITPSENPALQWNMIGKMHLSEPVFHPIMEQFDLKVTLAPSIYHHFASQKRLVCGPSLELNVTTNLVLHVTTMQCSVIVRTMTSWLHYYHQMMLLKKQASPTRILKPQQSDSGLCVAESYATSDKHLKTATSQLLGDNLITGKKVEILIYQFQKDDLLKPLVKIQIDEPSFVFYVSKVQQKLVFQVHNALVSVATSEKQKVDAIHKENNFPVSFIDTLTGKCNQRTGVPISLFTFTVDHFLSNKANLKLMFGRPVKILFSKHVFTCIKEVMAIADDDDLFTSLSSSTGSQSDALYQKFAVVNCHLDQIVIEVQNARHRLRTCFSQLDLSSQLNDKLLQCTTTISNISLSMQSSKDQRIPLLYPVTVKAVLKCQMLDPCWISCLNLHVSNVHCICSADILKTASTIGRTLLEWLSDVNHFGADNNVPSLETSLSHVSVLRDDDIRKGNYTYLTLDNVEPKQGQIVFSSKLPISTMSWCYNKPHAIKHVSITPIPFNEILGDGSDILCALEFYDEVSESYEKLKEFYVSETNFNDFSLFGDETPVHAISFASKWRISVHNTDRCHVSPLSLAASMNIKAVFDSARVPNLHCLFEVSNMKLTLTTPEQKFENVQLNLHKVNTSLKGWNDNKSLYGKCTFNASLNAIEFHSLTWLPVLLPVPLKINVMKTSSVCDISCAVSDTAEIHVSQRTIQSFEHMASSFSNSGIKESNVLQFRVHNCSYKTIIFGQALTDECIKLESGGVTSYSWRSCKIEPMLHVTVDGLSEWFWCPPFSPYTEQTIRCVVDNTHLLVAKIEHSDLHTCSISFHGCTRIFNQLDIDLQASVMVDGVMNYIPCVAEALAPLSYLFSLQNVSTILFKLSESNIEASDVVFANDLINSLGFTKLIHFTTANGDIVNAQVFGDKEEMIDVIVIMPLFAVCSYLPTDVILHVNSREKDEDLTVKLQGRGNIVQLKSLSPFAVHHLTIQLNENETPFDATIPFHFSLRHSLPNFDKRIKPKELTKYFPYDSTDYEADVDADWSPGDGNIQAKLSLYCKAVLVELVPWCLVHNQTELVFCISSPDECTSIVQPGQIVTIHHFTGQFHIHSSNSASSEWMTLVANPELEHPSRADKLKHCHLPFNGFQVVLLKSDKNVIELLLRSCVRHGVRVITIVPRWNFINNVPELQSLQVLPCVSQQLVNFNYPDCIVHCNADAPSSLLCWRTVVEPNPDVAGSKSNENDLNNASVESTIEKSNSSFLCVDTVQTSVAVEDRILCIKDLQLFSVVSVKDDFAKKVIDLHFPGDNILKKQLILTKHDYNGCFYIVLNDVKKKKYVLQNDTNFALCLQEFTDNPNNQTILLIKSQKSLDFESYMDTDLFPLCKRRYHSVKFQLRPAGIESWVEIDIPAKDFADQVLLPDTTLLFVAVFIKNNQVHVCFSEKHKSVFSSKPSVSFNSKVSVKELKLVLLDDLSNPLYSVDVVQLLFDDIDISFSRAEDKWIALASILQLQFDNQLYPGSDFPVFLSSSISNKRCCVLKAILYDDFLLNSIELWTEAIDFQSEGEFLLALSKLLQLYLSYSQPRSNNAVVSEIPQAVINEVKVLINPLRFHLLEIHPITVTLSLRASMAVCISVDHGTVTFSKFLCRDLDTTFHEIVQELTRHYFAEAVYSAGWVIGSVDLLGNPASTIRTYVKGISDIIVLPYQGIMHGPTAFFGGLTRGVASLLRHVSAGTLRSVTNVASGISRNLNYSSYQQQQNAQTSLAVLKLGSNPPRHLQNEEKSYVTGVTKMLVGVVTKPIGGAAGLVSKTGESILRRVGLEEHKTVRYSSASHATAGYNNSLTKYSMKLVSDEQCKPLQLTSLTCQVICLNGVSFSASLVLSSKTLYIFQLVDDILETSISVDDIDLSLECSEGKNLLLMLARSQETQKLTTKSTNYSNKVAEYLGVSSNGHATENSFINEFVKYTAEFENVEDAEAFMSLFNIIKLKSNLFDW